MCLCFLPQYTMGPHLVCPCFLHYSVGPIFVCHHFLSYTVGPHFVVIFFFLTLGVGLGVGLNPCVNIFLITLCDLTLYVNVFFPPLWGHTPCFDVLFITLWPYIQFIRDCESYKFFNKHRKSCQPHPFQLLTLLVIVIVYFFFIPFYIFTFDEVDNFM